MAFAWHKLYDIIQDAILIVTDEKLIAYANPAAQQLLNLTGDHYRLSDMLHPEDTLEGSQPIRLRSQSNIWLNIEVTLRSLDDQTQLLILRRHTLAPDRTAEDQLHAVYQVGQLLASTLNLKELYHLIYHEVAERILGCEHLCIAFYNEGAQTISANFLISEGEEVDTSNLPVMALGDGPNSQTVRTRQPLLVDMAELRDKLTPKGRIVEIGDTERLPRASLYLPLLCQEQVIGTLNFQSYDAGAFRQADFPLLMTLASQAAIAIQSARMIADLQISEERFRKIAEHITEVLYLFDRDTNQFTYISRNFEDIWQRPLVFLQPDSVAAIVDTIVPEDRERVVEAVRTGIKKDTYPLLNFNIQRPDGTIRTISTRFSNIFKADGTPHHIVGVLEDITEIFAAREQAKRFEIEQEKVNLLRVIIDKISYNIRTPLSTINTSLYLLERSADANQRKKRIDMVRNQVTVLNEGIEKIMLLTQLDTAVVYNRQITDINGLLRSVGTQQHDTAALHQIAVDFDLMDDLPRSYLDGWWITQALLQISDNAIRYTRKGGAISVRTFTEDDHIGIEFEDNGIGIEAETQPHIFERFFREAQDQHTGHYSAGLGLAIAHKVITDQGGSIHITSQPDQGTQVKVLLPAKHTH